MSTPFEELGLRAWADPEEIRRAYRALVKQCHPDRVQDPQEKAAAQERMIRLNLAYEEALRLATPRQNPAYQQELSGEEAVTLAERMLQKGKPENALRQLARAESRDAAWYYTQGRVLMQLEQYHSAHQSFREAVRREPDNNDYRAGALAAAVAEKKEKTLGGKVRKALRSIGKR
ncbi:MAG: DnaJ domain-containing protein [Clostridia bacterium]|nr:DnaJ domain-containing protein [Clostridia bacterium]